MRLLKKLAAPCIAALLSVILCAFIPEAAHKQAPIIVTAAPVYDALAALHAGERFPQGAQLLLVEHGNAKPLVQGFASTADASVSFDAKHVLFAGKKDSRGPWAIWEMNVADGTTRKVLSATDVDLIRPLYLPERRFIYARHTTHGFQIESAQLDGSNMMQLSFIGGSAIPEDVLADGRVLITSTYPMGVSTADGGAPELYLMYSDGSGVESYRCDHGAARWGGRQLATGDVVFTKGSTLARFTSARAEEVAISAPKGIYDGDIAEIVSGTWLLSARVGNAKNYVLTQWKGGASAAVPVFAKTGADVVEPVVLTPRNRPKQHPSAVHDWKYANLLALNARESRGGDLKQSPAAVRLETQDEGGKPVVMGTAPVEADGSFFVQVPGNKPLRFSLLDRNGTVIRQEKGWFWSRSGEQRICTGCHTGPERASENRVPAVLLHSTTPADLSGPHSSSSPVQGSR